MRVMLLVLALCPVVAAQASPISFIPVSLSSPTGNIKFEGTLIASALLGPILSGTLTVNGDPHTIEPQGGNIVPWFNGIVFRWKLNGHVLRIEITSTGTPSGQYFQEGLAGRSVRLW